MRKRKGVNVLLVIAALLVASCLAMADTIPIDPFNTRPATITNSSETWLQTILTGMGMGVNAATDQQTAGMWGTSLPPTIIPTLVIEYAGLDFVNTFGIWSGTTTDNVVRYDILLGPATGGAWAGTAAAVAWSNPSTIVVTAAGNGECDVSVNCGTFAGIAYSSFGFYLSNPPNSYNQGYPGYTFYTVDQLNSDGRAHALAYRQPGSGTWALAFEDLPAGLTDWDYNDMVVKVESLEPVPEPGTLTLLGTGLIGLAGLVRRKFKK